MGWLLLSPIDAVRDDKELVECDEVSNPEGLVGCI